ncbi:MAG: DUF72 domain-containing protein [bacterium]|nr:DUF72 domain-containing protein [bacterium]
MEAAEGGAVRVGPAGWSYADWEGTVYPREAAGKDRLGYLSRFFDCIEINSSFYRIPAPRVCAGWAERVAGRDRFRFTVKLYRGCTHGDGAPEEARLFRDAVSPIAEAGRLGAVLMQFPWSFRNGPDNRRRLERLADALEGLPLVIEVRHASWDEPAFHDFLRGRGIGFCNIDQPLFRGSMGPSAVRTSAVGYFRLHGRNRENWFREDAGRDERYDYLYSAEELAAWAARIEAVRTGGLPVYVIFNNHYGGKAACNALQLSSMLLGKAVDVPPSLAVAFPALGRLSAPAAGQGDLFD